ncbi:MAG: hypothetical protein KBH01_07670 [Breznakibacter sp.]|nr:hypothetical protein [Breznakibacter sp.]
MKSTRQHIALLILGLFFIPILFQSVHIVWHHNNGCCEKAELVCCGHHHENHYPQETEISAASRQCAICEYQFTITGLPVYAVFKTGRFSLVAIFSTPAIQSPDSVLFGYKSSRAPPAQLA